MENHITQMSDEGKGTVRWTRKVRQLTNERIINLPKQLEFFGAGYKVILSFDGTRVVIERV